MPQSLGAVWKLRGSTRLAIQPNSGHLLGTFLFSSVRIGSQRTPQDFGHAPPHTPAVHQRLIS